MANISRDTFRLTNVMHQTLTGEPVAEPRHYVGLRVEQGVPVLDADLNEAADIIRFASQIHLRHFFGDGIPPNSDGFRIRPVSRDNDFGIETGMALVGGGLAFNQHADLTYIDQRDILNVDLPDLAPPVSGTRVDLVYLDLWEEEVRATGSPRADARLMDGRIGMETAARVERRWVVRVESGVQEVEEISPVAGHTFMALARLRRTTSSTIARHVIIDARRTDLNVSHHLKIPMRAERGGVVVDGPAFAAVYDDLRTILTMRVEEDMLFLPDAGPSRTLALLALQNLLQQCTTVALQARTRNLDNKDALETCAVAWAGQTELLDALEAHGTAGDPLDVFLDGYRTRLEPLEQRSAEGDLAGAHEAQQLINGWLSAPVDALPEGQVSLQYLAVEPDDELVAGHTYLFTVEVLSAVSSEDQDEELFDISAELSSSLWTLHSFEETLLIENGERASLTVAVTPNAADPECDLTVRATARRNPTIRTQQPAIKLEIGVRPPVGGILFYRGGVDAEGRITLDSGILSGGFGQITEFALDNRTTEEVQYTVEWQIDPVDSDAPEWSPTDSAPGSVDLIAGAETVRHANLGVEGPADSTGVEGTITARIVSIDGETLSPDEQEELEVPFIVVS